MIGGGGTAGARPDGVESEPAAAWVAPSVPAWKSWAGSPALVTAMMATLFPHDAVGGFDGGRLGAQVAYWLSFSAFFFGLTYGLLQIAPEIAVLRRDVGRGARVGAYLLAKMTLLLPLLAIANVGMLAILRATNRLPDLPLSSWIGVLVAMSAVSFAALGLATTGLVRSAEGSSAVVNAIYLPMVFISGVFFSVSALPGFLEAIADVLPLTYLLDLVRSVFIEGESLGSSLTAVGVVALWGAAGLVVALRTFRWEPLSG